MFPWEYKLNTTRI